MKRAMSMVLLAIFVLVLFAYPALAADSKTKPVEIIETTYEGEHEDWTEEDPSVTPTPEEASEETGIPEEEVVILWTVDYDTENYPAEVTIGAPGTEGLPIYVMEYIDGGWVVIGEGDGPEITVTVETPGTLSVVTRIAFLYVVTKGMGGVWYQTTTVTLPFTCIRTVNDPSAYSHFTGIEVDGETIDPSCYTAVSGSVVLDLHPEYLSTLELGEHQLTYVYDDGEAGTNFFVRPISEMPDYPDKDTDAKAPQTGDVLWLFATGAITLIAIFAALVLTRRKEH